MTPTEREILSNLRKCSAKMQETLARIIRDLPAEEAKRSAAPPGVRRLFDWVDVTASAPHPKRRKRPLLSVVR